MTNLPVCFFSKDVTTPCSNNSEYSLPTLEDLGHDTAELREELFPGGEQEALRRLDEHMKRKVLPLKTHLDRSSKWVINQIQKAPRKLFWSSFTRDGSFASCLQEWVCRFEKPQTSPNSLSPSTTVLSPYVTFGCLSARLFWWKLTEVYQGVSVLVVCMNGLLLRKVSRVGFIFETFIKSQSELFALQRKHSDPPVSLHGQLLWREFFYTASLGIPNFNKMEGNSVCTQVDWDKNTEYLAAWREVPSPDSCRAVKESQALRREGVTKFAMTSQLCCLSNVSFKARTGFPFIDAIMTQLRQEGWIHHLARHAVACFLTRGDLWISWEEGQRVREPAEPFHCVQCISSADCISY